MEAAGFIGSDLFLFTTTPMSYAEKKIKAAKDKRMAVFNKTRGRCAYCGCCLSSEIGFHLDHIEPKRRYKYESVLFGANLPKGSDDIDNLFPCCQSCNSCKSDLTVEQFRKRVIDRVWRLNRYSSEYQIAKRFGLVLETEHNIVFYFETLLIQTNHG